MKNFFEFIPVKKNEVLKFTIISMIMLMILFIYSVERTVKDTIVINEMGAELISAIKLYGTFPVAILMILTYTKLSNEINKTTIFHIFNLFFLFYFVAFTFVLAPNIEYFYIDLSKIKSKYTYINYPISIIENWVYSLYFIFAELWGSIMLSLMFWQTANQVFRITEAKRLYPLFGLVAQIGMIMSGELLRIFSNKNVFKGGWQQSLEYINCTVLAVGIILSISYWILTNVVIDKKVINAEIIHKKKKASFIQSIKQIMTSRYIGLITTLILCYGISVNIVEGVWKAQAGAIYVEKQDYARFMANLQTFTGITSMIAMLSGSYLLTVLSWRVAAYITPFIILITGIIFYTFSIYQTKVAKLLNLSFSPVIIAVFIGLLQNVMGKATKYAFFDSTKEIAYIPLDEALKSKGKAAADVIGGRMGKSGGALIQQTLLTTALSFNSSLSHVKPGEAIISLSPILFVVFIVIMIIWLFAVNILSKEFEEKKKFLA